MGTEKALVSNLFYNIIVPLRRKGGKINYMNKRLLKIPQIFLIAVLITIWPQIWHNLPFPLNIQKSEAAIIFDRTSSEASMPSPVSISVSANYPDDLIYDGSMGSVGLTREPLLTMKWWGIVVYTETDNFIFECVSTDSPLPIAVFNLGAGEYKTSLSLAETKADCETFNQNEYPLFAVLEAANFTNK